MDPRTSESNRNSADQADNVFSTQQSTIATREPIDAPIYTESQTSALENSPGLSKMALHVAPPVNVPTDRPNSWVWNRSNRLSAARARFSQRPTSVLPPTANNLLEIWRMLTTFVGQTHCSKATSQTPEAHLERHELHLDTSHRQNETISGARWLLIPIFRSKNTLTSLPKATTRK